MNVGNILLLGQLTLRRQADQVVHDVLAHFVGALDQLMRRPDERRLALAEGTIGLSEGVHGNIRQQNHFLLNLRKRQRRRGQHALVQIGFHGLFALLILDQNLGNLHKHAAERQEQDGADRVEEGVEHGDLRGRRVKPAAERDLHERRPHHQKRKEDDGAERIEQKVNQTGPPRVRARAEGGHQRRDAGADIRA